jgi:methyl-accepting chemotaxis protein
MTPISHRTKSVARNLALLSLCGLTSVLVAVGIAIGVIEHRSTHALMVTSVAKSVQSIVAVANASDLINKGQVTKSFRSFRRDFDPRPEVDEASGRFMSLGKVVNDDFSVVDKYARETGGAATVFAKKGAELVAISTSLRKEDGTRAMGIILDSKHPAYKAILDGNSYTGAAILFGKAYMTHYEPAKSLAATVVGGFFVAIDISLQQLVLERQIEESRFFETGGVYFIDVPGPLSEARFITHPTGKGNKVLEVYPKAEKFLEAISTSPDGYVRDAYSFLSEPHVDKWAVMTKTQTGSGWLVAEVPEREAMAQYWRNMSVIWALLAATAVLLGVGLFMAIRRTVSKPLSELTGVVTSVAQGDLTKSFHTKRQDEIGALVNEVEGMRRSYLQALSQVRLSVDSIGTASAEIASGNQDLSARTEQTASNLQRTSSRMEMLTGTVQQSANAAREANQLAASAAAVAARGGSVVGQVVATMNDIKQSSRKISEIIGVIDGIAFQTNILALNAAVEAARAGEQGRGFAVVASEVRSLAGRSAQAAKEIKVLIGASVEKVESGSRLVQNAGNTMDEIVSSVKRVTDIIGEITGAAAEQSDSIGEVNISVNQLDQMTQQNAALVEESAAAAESLRDQAQRLSQAISVFKLTEGDVMSSPSPSQHAKLSYDEQHV